MTFFLQFYTLDKNHRPVKATVEEFERWWKAGGKKQRIIAKTQINPKVMVSSVFLGMDHSFERQPTETPILFETMIFGGEFDGEMKRSHTYEGCMAYHREAVEFLKNVN